MKSVQDFYDQQWKSSEGDIFSLAFTQAIGRSYSFLGELNGKSILEIGCGSGEQAVHFAQRGGLVTVIDISAESLNSTSQLAGREKVKLKTMLMNAQELKFPAESFDLVYINSTMMHVDQLRVFAECSRVLKKGGKLVILEPLQFAPLVRLYRLFSSYRKMKPHYMTFTMLKEGGKYFSGFRHEEFYLFSSLLLPVFSLRMRWLHRMYHAVAWVDRGLLRVFSRLRYGCWVCVAQYQK